MFRALDGRRETGDRRKGKAKDGKTVFTAKNAKKGEKHLITGLFI